ncbi:MAG: type III pantothenate kinase [Burkholderiales bacterium]|nr:type III pantothenate kinase [Burkholderiales bacterium]
MILAIDCGNTRTKWGLSGSTSEGESLGFGHPGGPRDVDAAERESGGVWVRLGAADRTGLASLRGVWRSMPVPAAVVIANVAGAAARDEIERALPERFPAAHWVRAARSQCGVTSAYAEPSELGADRWASLIGARALYPGPCLVVTAGTATTVDLLTARGHFSGGVILPGLDLMKSVLAARTAGLPLAQGRYAPAPDNTVDAIESGCLLAQAGAIERMFETMEAGAICVLSGGAAERVAPCLRIPLRRVEHLVLEGLVRIALERLAGAAA